MWRIVPRPKIRFLTLSGGNSSIQTLLKTHLHTRLYLNASPILIPLVIKSHIDIHFGSRYWKYVYFIHLYLDTSSFQESQMNDFFTANRTLSLPLLYACIFLSLPHLFFALFIHTNFFFFLRHTTTQHGLQIDDEGDSGIRGEKEGGRWGGGMWNNNMISTHINGRREGEGKKCVTPGGGRKKRKKKKRRYHFSVSLSKV